MEKQFIIAGTCILLRGGNINFEKTWKNFAISENRKKPDICVTIVSRAKEQYYSIEKYNLQDKIEFLGAKKNPYPYMKLADTVLLTSDYEGYPVVFIEALILNKPIITTDVSDAMQDINNKYGKVIKKDENELYLAMKEFIQNGYEVKNPFDYETYNENVVKTLETIF